MTIIHTRICGVYTSETALVGTLLERQVFRGAPEGTGLAFWLTSEGKKIVRVRERYLRAISLKDNRQKELLMDESGTAVFQEWWVPSFPEDFALPEDVGTIVEFSARSLPTRGATSIAFQGSISLAVATGIERRELSDVAIRNGPIANPDGLDVRIVHIGPGTIASRPYAIKFLLAGIAVDLVKSLIVVPSSGTAVEELGMTQLGSAPDTLEMEKYPAAPIATATLVLELWKGMEIRDVGVSARAKLGF